LIVIAAYAGSRGYLWGFAAIIAFFIEKFGVALWTADYFGFLITIAFVYWPVDGLIVIAGRRRKAAIFSAIRQMQSAQPEDPAPPPWASR